MDLRTRTTLLCGALALAIAASVLLRGRTRSVHLVFAAFASDVGFWYLAQSLFGVFHNSVWARATALLAIALPQLALRLFEEIVPPREGHKSPLPRLAAILAIPVVVLVLSPLHYVGAVRAAILFYALVSIAAGLWALALRGQQSESRATKRRVQLLVVIGALSATFTFADFLWFIGAELPPVGAVLSIVFLFLLSESLRRERLLDMYELVGRLLVSTALAFVLAGIFYIFVTYIGRLNTMYLNAVLAAIVILVLFEPLRIKVEQQIHRVFFRERMDLENAVLEARRKLVHVLEIEELDHVVVLALEQSRRATSAALFLSDRTGSGFDLAAGIGSDLPQRIERATARPLLERAQKGSVVIEEVTRDLELRRIARETAEVGELEAIVASAAVLGPLREGVVLGIRAETGDLIGLLVVADDRVRDAYAPEEVVLLESLAAQIGVVIENSFLYRRLQDRDRLAAIGQMAARLAHEVKNPLGAIKGAAQLLAEPGHAELDLASREFVGIILEEVDRLDRVVGSVLDYARPSKGSPSPVDINAVVRRTIQILSSDRALGTTIELTLAEDLPPVRVDAEQLRQVLMNLVRNAIQAMNGEGRVVVTTRLRDSSEWEGSSPLVELAVSDSGPGISRKVLKNLFVPFFTTKNQGTGLGLAISQRIIQASGGSIDVRSDEGAGTTFTIVLPPFDAPLVTSTKIPVGSAEAVTANS